MGAGKSNNQIYTLKQIKQYKYRYRDKPDINPFQSKEGPAYLQDFGRPRVGLIYSL